MKGNKGGWSGRLARALAAAVVVASTASGAGAVDIFNTDKLGLSIYGRMQMLGVAENVPDHVADHNRIYLFMKQARVGFKGYYEDDFKYDMQLAFGGEDANGSNTDLSLLDMVGDFRLRPLSEDTWFKVGQFRVPYSREGLTDRGYMIFADRSIASLASFQGRDYGVALASKKDHWVGTLGTFSSGGRDVPQRYLPERLGVPEAVARVGYNDGIDEDIYHVVGQDRELKRTGKAFYINGIYEQDTRIGHSTALNLRTIDKNVLIDSQFNPYINRGDGNGICSAVTCERGNLFFVGSDAVVRKYLDVDESVEGEAEGNWGGYQNRFGVLHIASGRVQGSYRNGRFSAGLRYAILSMDSNSGYIVAFNKTTPNLGANGTLIPGTNGQTGVVSHNSDMGRPIHEITPAVSWQLRRNVKVLADFPLYLGVPLFMDNADGAYVFPDPTSVDQNTVLNTVGNNVTHKTVAEARLMFQYTF